MLTDRAQDGVEKLGPWLILGIYGLITHALSRHVGWLDAAAVVLAFGQFNRALGSRGKERSDG